MNLSLAAANVRTCCGKASRYAAERQAIAGAGGRVVFAAEGKRNARDEETERGGGDVTVWEPILGIELASTCT